MPSDRELLAAGLGRPHATLFVGFAFAGGRLAAWTRWLFVVNGIGGLIGFVVFGPAETLPEPVLNVDWAGLGTWNVTFPAATVLAALTLRRKAPLGASAATPRPRLGLSDMEPAQGAG